MKIGDAFPGRWLKSGDLGDDDHVVTITDVRSEMIGQGNDSTLKLVMEFKEFDRPLVLNKTNATVCEKILGSDDTDDWIGKQIVLWVNHDVQFGNEIVSAIRVRNKAPKTPAPKTAAPMSAALLTYAGAVALCATVGIAEADMKGYLKSQGLTKWDTETCTPKVRTLIANLEPTNDADDDAESFE